MRKVQIPALFLFDTGAGLNLISESILLSSWRDLVQNSNVPLLRTANKKQLEIE